MAEILIQKHINALLEEVFEVFSDLEQAPHRIEGITKLELLTPPPVGKGTRFRETRIMFKKEATEEMEMTEFEPPSMYRVETVAHGAHYDCTYHFAPAEQGTTVSMSFVVTPRSFFAKLFAPLTAMMMGSMKKCMDGDMEDLKKYLESRPST